MWIRNEGGMFTNLDQFGGIGVHKLQDEMFQVIAYYSGHNGFEVLKQTKTEKEALAYYGKIEKALTVKLDAE